MKTSSVVLLLDSAPLTWTSQEDRHFRLCQALTGQGVTPVLVYAEPLRPHIHARLQAGGAVIPVINYGRGVVHYYRELRKLVKAFSITAAHIVFFDYFSALPWIARLCGIRGVIYEMQNSGELHARSWKKALLRLRTWVMTYPTDRVIAISEFVKKQLVTAGVPEDKIVVRYLGVNTERFRPDPQARRQWADRFSVSPNELILSTVSYLRPFKHPEVLVQTCRELAARRIPARLFVAGDGDMLSSRGSVSSWASRTGSAGSGTSPSRKRCCRPRTSSSWPRWVRRSAWCLRKRWLVACPSSEAAAGRSPRWWRRSRRACWRLPTTQQDSRTPSSTWPRTVGSDRRWGIGRSSASDGTSPSIATSRKRSTCTRCSEDESNREPPRSQLAR